MKVTYSSQILKNRPDSNFRCITSERFSIMIRGVRQSISIRANSGKNILGRIQDLTKGASDKRPSKAVAPRGVRGHARPENFSFEGL